MLGGPKGKSKRWGKRPFYSQNGIPDQPQRQSGRFAECKSSFIPAENPTTPFRSASRQRIPYTKQ
jgi:hypothetical protein